MAVVDKSTPASPPRRRRRTNNLAQSLGRMMQVKNNTAEWLKGVDRVQGRDGPRSVSLHSIPPSLFLVPPVVSESITETAWEARPLLHSPLDAWTGGTDLPVRYACSFCLQPFAAGVHIDVEYNPMLPSPFVLTCLACKI